MNMKRILALALMALLMCLPVWAMAVTHDVATYPSDNPFVELNVNDGDVITGTASGRSFTIYVNQTQGNESTLTIKDLSIQNGTLIIERSNNSSSPLNLKLNFEGTNTLAADPEYWAMDALQVCGNLEILSGNVHLNGYSGLRVVDGDLTIQNASITAIQNGYNELFAAIAAHGNLYINSSTMKVSDLWTERGGNFLLPEYAGTIPDGMRFKAWNVGGKEMRPSERAVLNGEYRITPVFEQIPTQFTDLPQTGDDSNVMLWSALAFISLIGMTMLVRKRKEA